jgi:two-component system, chemotaxis family, chemotaxis protein CheY
MSRPRILSVGQCGFDHSSISRFLSRAFAAEVRGAETVDEALAMLQGGRFDLVLVNRVNDADGAPGVDLIRTMKDDSALAEIPVMLVSDFADAQSEAAALGALAGFGKSELASAATHDRIARALGVPV